MPETTAPDFLLLGVNHHRAGVAVRERFSLTEAQQVDLLARLRALGTECGLVMGTCNRTEVFARTANPEALRRALLEVTGNAPEDLGAHGHELRGEEALERLFHIAAGLDSQILGDLQIVKQVKDAYQLACDHHLADATLHRLMQHAVRAHKRVRRETDLGKGAASIAGAAVQWVMNQTHTLHNRHILLLGTGKIGKVTCKNLLSHNPRSLTLINRTDARAQALGHRFNVRVAAWENLVAEIAHADVIIVATGASQPVLLPHHVQCPGAGPKWMVDLSMPRNIHPDVAQIRHIRLADLDDLQAATDAAYQDRLAAIPAARALVAHELENFAHWLAAQRVAPTIRAFSEKLEDIRRQELAHVQHKLSDAERQAVERVTDRIVKKIAALGIDQLRTHAPTTPEAEEWLRALFRLEPPIASEAEIVAEGELVVEGVRG